MNPDSCCQFIYESEVPFPLICVSGCNASSWRQLLYCRSKFVLLIRMPVQDPCFQYKQGPRIRTYFHLSLNRISGQEQESGDRDWHKITNTNNWNQDLVTGLEIINMNAETGTKIRDCHVNH